MKKTTILFFLNLFLISSFSGFSTGIYVLKLESGANQLTKKLIIK